MSPYAPGAHRLPESLAMPLKLRSLVSSSKPDIRINLSTRNKTYTTLDRIEGTVTITAPVDTPFDTLDIEFAGSSRTYVERLTTTAAASGRAEAFHQFLKLSQPGLPHLYPENSILLARKTYQFPFVFAIPQQLLPRICQHPVHAESVRDAHCRLPPTLGDKALVNQAGALDDMAPDMASVRYGVFVRLTVMRARGNDTWRSTLAAKARRVRVVPAIEEQPPLDVQAEDVEYVMRKERTIRRNMLSAKTGTLVIEATQPRAFQLQSYSNPDARVDTLARMHLRFDPVDDKAQPPKLNSLVSKLKVTTYFACTARRGFPSKSAGFMDVSQGMHAEQLPLSSRCMAGVDWIRHEAGEDVSEAAIERRDSAISTLSHDGTNAPTPTAAYKGKTYYTARIVVPVTLPTHKAFPPTFHSCLISRVYTLKLELHLARAGLTSSVDLKLPVQVSTEGLVGDEYARSGSVDISVETDIEGEDVSSFFEPRPIRTPNETFIGRSRIGSQAPVDDSPPGYSALPPGSRVMYAETILPARSMTVPVY